MWESAKNYFYQKISASRAVHRTYIIPTIDGLKVIALNATLLIIGLVYANNYVLLFNFILFCLFLGSMFYTHFNLSGIKLESVQLPSLHVNEHGAALFHFSTTNAQGHSFIKAYFKSNIIEITDREHTFPIPFGSSVTASLSIKGIKRGQELIQSLYIETQFPFNFFRCFTFFRIDLECFIYPERMDLNLHEEIEIVETTPDEGDDFFLRDYQVGDSLKRVDWKKLAQTNRWYTRQYQSTKPKPILLVLDKTPVEDTLKSICFSLHALHHQNIKYGIKLKQDILISPENSPKHLSHCLTELARYEA